MKKYLDKVKDKFKKDGLIKTAKKVSAFLLAYIIRYSTYNKSNQKKWKKIKNSYAGKRVFILGNGPSLNDTPLYLLKGEYTMCFNRINILFERLQWRPTFYSCVDATVVQDNADEINELIVPEVSHAFFTDFHMFEFTNIKGKIKDGKNVYWLYSDVNEFSYKLPSLGPCPTVAIAALQILPFLGFTEIYILGMDMNYKIHTTVHELQNNEIQAKDNDDPNHFDPRYFGKGKKYHQPTAAVIENTFKALRISKQKLDEIGVKTYNATYGGKVDIFPRVNFETLFNLTSEEKFKLFAETFRKHIVANTFDELVSKVPVVYDVNTTQLPQIFLLDSSIYKNDTNALIMNFIPFGPFEGKFLLVKR
jgi:hypothetical protein